MPSTPPKTRAAELLQRMTLEEKVAQLSGEFGIGLLDGDDVDQKAAERLLGSGIGHIACPPGTVATARQANAMQRYLVEQTRLGIPAILHTEALNGVIADGYTSFPTPIALAAAWDPDAVQSMADVIRRQLRSLGIRQALAPVMDIARDARWGRVHETYGEDVYLASELSVAYTRGVQGTDLSTGVIATAKHFLGYGTTEGGQNMAASTVTARELYDVYATPFEAAIHLAGLSGIMNSYSDVDGVPVGVSRAVLTDLLRDKMGFTGAVVSDYLAVEWLLTRQHVTADLQEAGVLALAAGLDVELPSTKTFGSRLVDAVNTGLIGQDHVDTAVLRVLTQKFQLGLFDDPYVQDDTESTETTQRLVVEGADLSQRLAEQAITLLKNRGGTLPLARGTRVAVIGPHADSALVNFAAYTFPASVDMLKHLVSGEVRMAGVDGLTQGGDGASNPLMEHMRDLLAVDSETLVRQTYQAQSLSEAFEDLSPGTAARTAAGVGITAGEPQDIAAAVAATAEADVIALALGGRAGWFGGNITEGEGTDIAEMELPAQQVELVQAAARTGKPLIGVVFQGRPTALSEVDDLLDAVLIAYYPGPHGARAIAQIILGDLDPSGRLPYTMPRSTGQLPIHYAQRRGSGYRRTEADQHQGYIDLPSTPLYPFGHGLSYTTFEYSSFTADASSAVTDGGVITVEVNIENTGTREGTEVVQFYVSDTATGVSRPELQLVGFTRLRLRPAESGTVRCRIDVSQLGYTGLDGRFVIEPGSVQVACGSSSDVLHSRVTVDLIGDVFDLAGRRSYLSRTSVL